MGELLADDVFKTGQGIPFIALEGEGDDAKFCMCDEAREFLCSLKAPLALASIVGKYRTGKSLLVNRMLLDIKGGGFPVGATVNSCTKGLWIWNRPLICRQADGQSIQLLIIDTEGLGSLDADADHDAKIFALALLLSSYFIYNSVGSIDEAALNSLSLVVELTKHIKTKSEKESNEPETGETFASFFPGFLWVVRDFTLQLVDEHNAPISAKAYLDRALRPMQGFSEGVEVKNRIRRMLQAFFPNRDCVTLKRPVEDESKLQSLDNADWGDFRPEFVDQVKVLRHKIFSSAPAKTVNGKVLDGFMLSHLAEQYAHSINTGSALNIGDAWSQVSASKNSKALEDAAAAYESAARDLESSLPLSVGRLQELHDGMEKDALAAFRRESIGSSEELSPFLAQLADRMETILLGLKQANERAAREAALETLAALYADIGSHVQAGHFASFKEYEAARKAAREEYVRTCPDTPAKMEVLLAFMEGNLSLAALLLEEQAAAAAQASLAEKEEELRASAHERELESKRAAGMMEELETKVAQAAEQLADGREREEALQLELEEMRARHEEQLAEEVGSLRSELRSTQAAMESEVDRLTRVGREAAHSAADENRQLLTKVALLQQQQTFAEDDRKRLTAEHTASAAQLLEANAQLDALKRAHKRLEVESAAAREQAASRDDYADSCHARIQALEAQLGEVRDDRARLLDAIALAKQTEQAAAAAGGSRSSLTPHREVSVSVKKGQDWQDWGGSPGGAAVAGETAGVQRLRSELLEARAHLVDAQQRSLAYADEVDAMRAKMDGLQRQAAEQQTQLESVTAVNLYCLQRAAAFEGLQRSVSELTDQKRRAEQQRDDALAELHEARLALAERHGAPRPQAHEKGANGLANGASSTRDL